MAILTEPTILRDDNFDSGVLLYLYFGAASPDDRLFVYRYDDDAPFFIAGPDLIAVGVGNAFADKYIYANTGEPDPPALRYSVTSGQWEYSNDGSNFLPIGSGGGGGGGGGHTLLSSTHVDTQPGGVQLGDIIVGNGTPRWSRLAGNVTTTKKFLAQTGTGTVSAIPQWDVIAPTDLPSHSHTRSDIADFVHASTHVAGGSDPLTGNLNAIARVGVRKNSGGSTYNRRRINLIEGTNVTISLADDSVNEEVDVTISSALPLHASAHASGGSDALTGNLDAIARVGARINSGVTTYQRRRLNFIAGTGISLSLADDAIDEEVDITIDSSTLPHASAHATGGSDPLVGDLDAIARVGVRKNSGGATYSRRRINLIEGTNVSITLTEDPDNEEVDVTLSASSILPSAPFADLAYYRVANASYYYSSVVSSFTATTLGGSANRLAAIPFIVPRKTTIGTLNAFVTTAASGNIKLAIYADNGTYGYPGSLVAGSSDISSATTGLKTWNANVTLAPGLYWLAIHFSAAPTMRAVPVASSLPILGWDNTLSIYRGSGWYVTSTYSSGLPSSFPTGSPTAMTTFYALYVTISGYPADSPSGYAPAEASYVVLGNDATLTNERVLAVGNSLVLSDGGANGNVTLDAVQDIRTSATPTFAGLKLSGITGVMVSGGAGGISGIAASAGNQYLRRNAANTAYEFGYVAPEHMQPASGNGNMVIGVNAAGDSIEYKSVAGTNNRVIVSHGVGSITLSTPQDLHTAASVQFASLSLSSGLTLGFVSDAVLVASSSGQVSGVAATQAGQVLASAQGGGYEFVTLVYPAHASSHESSGADPILGNLDANARVGVRLNTGTTTYKRRRINFLAGSNISLSMADDPSNEEIRVTITGATPTGAPSNAPYVVWEETPFLTRSRYLIDGVNTLVAIDDVNGTIAIDTVQDPLFTDGLQIGTARTASVYTVEMNMTGGMANFRYSTTSPGFFIAGRSNSDTVGIKAAMPADGLIGRYFFACINPANNDWALTASVAARATAAHSSNSLPTKLEFYTTDSGSASATLRMTITERGFVHIGGTTSWGHRLFSYYGSTNPPDSAVGALYADADVTFNTYSSQTVYNVLITTIRGSANVTGTQYGALLYGYNYNTATVSFLVGAQAWIRNLSTGTISYAIALRVGNASNSGGGTITNQYGLYIENLTTATNNYGIYITGSNQYAYYAAGGQLYNAGVAGFGVFPTSTVGLRAHLTTSATTLVKGIEVHLKASGASVNAMNNFLTEVTGGGASRATAVYGEVVHSAAVTTTEGVGFLAYPNVSAGTISNWYAFRAWPKGGTGTITTSYGLMVDSGYTYGLWISGGRNYLAGQTGIGAVPVTSAFLSISNATTISAIRFTGSSDVTNPVSGDLWYDSFDLKLRKSEADHRLTGWTHVVITPQTVTNTTTETTVMTWTVPGGYLAGRRKIRVQAFGRYSNSGSAATLTIRAKYGSSVITVSHSAATGTNRAVGLEYWISSTTSTSSQMAYLNCFIGGSTSYSSSGTVTAQLMAESWSGACVPAVDSTTAQALAITVQWSMASTALVFELMSATVETF